MNPPLPLGRVLPTAAASFLTAALAVAAPQEQSPPPQEGSGDPAEEPATEPPTEGPTLEERVTALEQENDVLREQLDITATEIERFDLRDVFPQVGDSRWGLGPAASKVYEKDQGLSIGGYGELLYRGFQGTPDPDRLNLLRAVFYFGYKFNDHWVFNSEIEFENATTSKNGSVSVEFAYLDYLHKDWLNARIGLVLIPMGFINEIHEPTTFLGVTRPETELRIMPSTWRENGVGAFGESGSFRYRAYVVNGFDATGFTAAGLRGGRQSGSRALANDFAAVGRLDWSNDEGLLIGGSAYYGNSGQGQPGLGATGTGIFEAHLEFRRRSAWLRALGSFALVEDVAELNNALGFTGEESVGEEQYGAYATFGYDVIPHIAPKSSTALSPFVRYERINTQAKVPTGFLSNPANDNTIVSIGLNFMPIDQIVFKASYQDWDNSPDRIQALLGYVF